MFKIFYLQGVAQPLNYTISKQLVQTTINKWNARALRADNTTVITIFFEFPEILDDEEDQVDLASVRQWRQLGLSLNQNYQFDGAKSLLSNVPNPSRFDPFRVRKCWHYNFTAKANELCKVCRNVVESEQVRAYSSREQTVFMQSPKGPWITAKEHRSELDKSRKRDAEHDDYNGPITKKHKMECSTPHGAQPNKEIMVNTVKGLVRVQIYGFGKTDQPDELINKEKKNDQDSKEEDSKKEDESKEEETPTEEKKDDDGKEVCHMDVDFGAEVEVVEEEVDDDDDDVDDDEEDGADDESKMKPVISERLSAEQSAELEKELDEEKRILKQQKEAGKGKNAKKSIGEKSDAISKKDSIIETLEAAETSQTSVSRTDDSQSKEKESTDQETVSAVKDIVPKDVVSAVKRAAPVAASPPILRKSPRHSSKLTCLKDSNCVTKSRYNTRYSLSPKGAIKRALRTVNGKTMGQQRYRTKSLPAAALLKNKAVTRSAVKIR